MNILWRADMRACRLVCKQSPNPAVCTQVVGKVSWNGDGAGQRIRALVHTNAVYAWCVRVTESCVQQTLHAVLPIGLITVPRYYFWERASFDRQLERCHCEAGVTTPLRILFECRSHWACAVASVLRVQRLRG